MKHSDSDLAEIEPAEWGELERSLFRAGREDAPAATRASVLAALGLEGPGPGPGGSAAGGGGRVHTSEPPRPIPWSPAPAATSGAGKWLAFAAVAAAIPVALWLLNRGHATNEGAPPVAAVVTPAPKAPEAPQQPAAQVAAAAVEAPSTDAAAQAAADKPVSHGAAATVQRAAAQRPAGETLVGEASAEPSLAEEVALIRRAKAQVASGDAAGALATLDDHDARFKKPKLQSEATVLRIDALLKSGRQAEARRLAAPIIASDSPYATRVRTLVGNTAP